MKLRKMDIKKIEIFKHPFFKMKKMNKKGMQDTLFPWLIGFLIIFVFVIIYIFLMFWNFPEKKGAIIIEPPRNDELNFALNYYHFDKFLDKKFSVDGENIKILDAIKKSLDPYFETKPVEEGGFSFSIKGESFAETFFEIDGEGIKNGLETLSYVKKRGFTKYLRKEGFDYGGQRFHAIRQNLERGLVNFEKKSKLFPILVKELNEICDQYIFSVPQGAIYSAYGGRLIPTPPRKGYPWNEKVVERWIELERRYSYGGYFDERDVYFGIIIKIPERCLKNLDR